MLKNMHWTELARSKTFWGSFLALAAQGAKVLFPENAALVQGIQDLSLFLAAIGVIDRTAPK